MKLIADSGAALNHHTIGEGAVKPLVRGPVSGQGRDLSAEETNCRTFPLPTRPHCARLERKLGLSARNRFLPGRGGGGFLSLELFHRTACAKKQSRPIRTARKGAQKKDRDSIEFTIKPRPSSVPCSWSRRLEVYSCTRGEQSPLPVRLEKG